MIHRPSCIWRLPFRPACPNWWRLPPTRSSSRCIRIAGSSRWCAKWGWRSARTQTGLGVAFAPRDHQSRNRLSNGFGSGRERCDSSRHCGRLDRGTDLLFGSGPARVGGSADKRSHCERFGLFVFRRISDNTGRSYPTRDGRSGFSRLAIRLRFGETVPRVWSLELARARLPPGRLEPRRLCGRNIRARCCATGTPARPRAAAEHPEASSGAGIAGDPTGRGALAVSYGGGPNVFLHKTGAGGTV